MMFIIQGLPRTGTNLIRTILRQHPSIECYGEIFHKKIGKGYTDHSNDKVSIEERDTLSIEELLNILKTRSKKNIFGFSAHSFTGLAGHQSGFDNFWSFIPSDTKIIRVRRNNLLRQFISLFLSHKSKKWVVEKRFNYDQSQIKKIIVTKQQLDNEYNFFINSLDTNVPVFKNTLNIVYENLINNIEYYIRIILEFLEQNISNFNIDWSNVTVKLTPTDLSDVIENYDELVSEINGTMWEPYLYQP